MQSKASTDKATAQLQSLVKLLPEHGVSRKADFDGVRFRRFAMDNAKWRLEALLQEPAKDTPVSEATRGTITHKTQVETQAKCRKEVFILSMNKRTENSSSRRVS